MDEICVRNSLSGVSSGISTYGAEDLDVADLRLLGSTVDDLRDPEADVLELLLGTLPGILFPWVWVRNEKLRFYRRLFRLVVKCSLHMEYATVLSVDETIVRVGIVISQAAWTR